MSLLKDFPFCLPGLPQHLHPMGKGILDSRRETFGLWQSTASSIWSAAPLSLTLPLQHPPSTASGEQLLECGASSLRGSLAPRLNSLDCSKVRNHTLSRGNFFLWLAPNMSDPASTSMSYVSANLIGDSTCLKSRSKKFQEPRVLPFLSPIYLVD